MNTMALPRLTDFYYEKKRIAHRQGSNTNKQGEGSKQSPEEIKRKELQILKDFDINQDFGPCIGITRLERWERAQKHDLNPPLVVKDLVLLNLHDEEYTESLWYSYNTLQ